MFKLSRYKITTAAIAAAVVAYECAPYTKSLFRSGAQFVAAINARLLDATITSATIMFNYMDDYPTTPDRRKDQNGHAHSGSDRDNARRAIHAKIRAAGYEPYNLQPARVDGDQAASHEHIVEGDLHRESGEDEITKNHFIVAIDVDYYITEESLSELALTGQPMAFYTFQPRAAAGMDNDTPFTINEQSEIIYEVSNGGRWRHRVWDWSAGSEFVTFTEKASWRRPASWILSENVVYKRVVMQTSTSTHRAIVWLLPQQRYKQIRFLPPAVRQERVKRMDYSCSKPGWNLVRTLRHDGEEPTVSVARAGTMAEVTMKQSQHDMMMGLLSSYSVATKANQEGFSGDKTAIIAQYYLGTNVPPLSQPVMGAPALPAKPLPHVPLLSLPVSPDTASWRTISPSLVGDPALVPQIKKWEAMEASIEFRISKNVNTTVPGEPFTRYAREFVELLVPESAQGQPYSLEQTIELMDKPTQQAAIRQILETITIPPKELIEGFIKNECTIKDPRVISSFPDVRFLLMLSRFTLAMRDEILHKQNWFCPGNTPAEIADRVIAYFVKVAGNIMESDFSSFDGTVSAWLQRNVMCAAYLRFFPPEYRNELGHYLNTIITCGARAARFGFKYEAGPGVKSGAPTTCDGNTMMNAFLMYCAVRKTSPQIGPQGAFEEIGLAFGDDGLFDRCYHNALNHVVKQIGMSVKIPTYKEDEGFTFLARVYYDPTMSNGTFQDPVRTLRKIHYTARNTNVPLEDAAWDRADGYLATDAQTPIISSYCHLVQRSYTSTAKRASRADRFRDRPYWSYQNCGDSWPQYAGDYDKMAIVMAKRIGIDKSTLVAYDTMLQSGTTIDDIKPLWVNGEPYDYQNTVSEDGVVMERQGVLSNKQSTATNNDNHDAELPESTNVGRTEPEQSGSAGSAKEENNAEVRAPCNPIPLRGTGRGGRRMGFRGRNNAQPRNNAQLRGHAPQPADQGQQRNRGLDVKTTTRGLPARQRGRVR
jgi:hypothetical protein